MNSCCSANGGGCCALPPTSSALPPSLLSQDINVQFTVSIGECCCSANGLSMSGCCQVILLNCILLTSPLPSPSPLSPLSLYSSSPLAIFIQLINIDIQYTILFIIAFLLHFIYSSANPATNECLGSSAYAPVTTPLFVPQ